MSYFKKTKTAKIILCTVIPVSLLITTSVTSCAFSCNINSEITPITYKVFKENKSFQHAYQRSLSLHFNYYNPESQTIDHIYGTGWIFDFEPYDLLQDIRTYYIATNIHVISAVSKNFNNATLTLGNAVLTEKNFDHRLVEYQKNKVIHSYQPNSFNKQGFDLMIVGDNSQSQYENQASDLAIIRLSVNKNIYNTNPVLKNFDPTTGISYANVRSNSMITGVGYPRSQSHTYISFHEQKINKLNDYILNANEENYRADNPIIYYNHKYSNNRRVEKKYSSYDIGIKNFNLGGGASGSMIVDQNQNQIGIYWGGLEIKEQFGCAFYGNFTPLVYKDKQNLFVNYFDALRKYKNQYSIDQPTYLELVRQTNIQISSDEFEQLNKIVNNRNNDILLVKNILNPFIFNEFNDSLTKTNAKIEEIYFYDKHTLVLKLANNHLRFVFKIQTR
ncbi:DUF31 family protein [Ureaplasma sp. ES3154-GEN]|uniref:DUF31 family protein n=1 Tax=Ureaplasma sp. ES3154-GEN TaxID=2984844 RepID=UPI0021E964C5|nr:DUF31 family protein [Ureaplasma sp. ES3154-GEN]MCV3743633.1 DUF31 family protein [Ureaplasma sp. ES3154-GEN]